MNIFKGNEAIKFNSPSLDAFHLFLGPNSDSEHSEGINLKRF